MLLIKGILFFILMFFIGMVAETAYKYRKEEQRRNQTIIDKETEVLVQRDVDFINR